MALSLIFRKKAVEGKDEEMGERLNVGAAVGAGGKK